VEFQKKLLGLVICFGRVDLRKWERRVRGKGYAKCDYVTTMRYTTFFLIYNFNFIFIFIIRRYKPATNEDITKYIIKLLLVEINM